MAKADALVKTGADTIMCMNDSMAMGVMDGLDQLGVRVPDDVWVTGFDGSISGRLARYDLTTWEQPLADMVEQTVVTLMALMEGQAVTSTISNGTLRSGGSAPL